ncbi:MAG TPA: hypothetical protein VFE33_22880 [Thermoanaerobaculia bacterium]|nr:hypothetical protein [Thermoanaerobaculia bacterium]
MTKISFAERTHVWRGLIAPPEEAADEIPGLAELRGELSAILEETLKTRTSCQRLRSRALVEAKRLERTITRGEEAEQRLRHLIQAAYGPTSPQLHRFGLKPRRGRRPERSDGPGLPVPAAEAAGSE